MQVATYKKLPSNVIWANSLRLGFAPRLRAATCAVASFFSGGGSTLRGFPLDLAGPQRALTACGIPNVPSTCTQITCRMADANWQS